MADEQKKLDILCDVPLKIHVGEEEIEVFPPTLAKLNAAAPLWAKLINKATDVAETLGGDEKKEVDIEMVLKNIYKFIDDLLPIFKIYLAPRGKIDSKWTPDQLREGLDILDMRRTLIFIREGIQLEELLKNAIMPVMSEPEKTPADHGQK